ncbi:MAG: GNAT family N-acetyltransferase [Bdellovibrionota bacterium]
MTKHDVTVSTYHELLKPAFIALNRQWIEYYFKLEPMDLQQLENPQKTILESGGEIFFILEDKRPVGTVAMIPIGDGSYELAKMAVEPGNQGKGYGDLLMKAAVEWAKLKKAKEIILISNQKLIPALSLYRKFGFKVVSLAQHPDYQRGNIEMKLTL